MPPGGIELVPSDYESSALTTELSQIKYIKMVDIFLQFLKAECIED